MVQSVRRSTLYTDWLKENCPNRSAQLMLPGYARVWECQLQFPASGRGPGDATKPPFQYNLRTLFITFSSLPILQYLA